MPYKNPEKAREANREYQRRHYNGKSSYYKEKAASRRKALAQLVKELKGRPCADCGQSFPPYVMDFDHRGEKECDVSRVVRLGWGLARINAEVAKCDVVCANCHRQRTWERMQAA